MKSVNKVILLGNVGQVPETRTLKTGTILTTVSIATNDRFKNQKGEWQDRTEWHSVLCYGRLGEIARDYLRKGSKVYVDGRIRTDKWEDDAGRKHYRNYIVANDVTLLDQRDRHEPSEDLAPASRKTSSPTAPDSADYVHFDEEVPF